MATPKNPFVVSGLIDPEYFCDRKAESSRLIKSVSNGNNMLLISPPAWAKLG